MVVLRGLTPPKEAAPLAKALGIELRSRLLQGDLDPSETAPGVSPDSRPVD